ncbi:MAG: YhfC family intramembrane metalloprotease, partial [Anaerolineaceae bacterium]|nr:YhfC family intramembrane metalloprotease [Anaerolineaceae bacterium]
HLSLSSLVWLSVRNKKASFLILAIAWHALVNSVVVYLSGIGWSPIALEGVMAIATVVSVVVLRQIYQQYGKDSLYALEKLPSEAPLQDAS